MFILVGTNYRYCPLEIRQHFCFWRKSLPADLACLQEKTGIKTAVILSTCNRVEIYAEAAGFSAGVKALTGFLRERYQDKGAAISLYFYSYQEQEAFAHLLSVATGIDSLIVGEPQIMEQIETALALARESGMSGDKIEALFGKALATGQRIRYITKIDKQSPSLGALVKEWLREYTVALDGKKIVMMGMGTVTRLVLECLKDEGVVVTLVANKARRKAQYLASSFPAAVRVAGFEELKKEVLAADILISATSSPHTVITPAVVGNREKPLVALDLAVPCDIDPVIKQIPGVAVFHVEELESFFQRQLKEQIEKIPHVRTLIAYEVENIVRGGELRLREEMG